MPHHPALRRLAITGRALAGATACAAVATAYGALAWWIVFVERWGPVVAVVDERGGHGVHTGDAVGILAGLMAALFGFFAVVLLDEALGAGWRAGTARVAHRGPAEAAPHAQTPRTPRVARTTPVPAQLRVVPAVAGGHPAVRR